MGVALRVLFGREKVGQFVHGRHLLHQFVVFRVHVFHQLTRVEIVAVEVVKSRTDVVREPLVFVEVHIWAEP